MQPSVSPDSPRESGPAILPIPRPMTGSMKLLLATACGLTAANLYYAQPLAGPIAASLGLPPSSAGLVVTLTQIGYGLGLLLIVPLADLVENRRLTVTLLLITAVALLGAALLGQAVPFLTVALLIGLGSVAVQVLVGLAAHLSPEAVRGRDVGTVVSGLSMGIMLARPVASFMAQVSSWHTVFFASAAMMLLLALVLTRALPVHRPTASLTYPALLRSMVQLVGHTPVLRQRAFYHACLFAAFSVFWTTTPLLLAGPAFRLSQGQIALFALAGVSGTVAAPLAGRLADRGWNGPATLMAILAVAASFLLSHFLPLGSAISLGLLVVAAILLDAGTIINLVISQRALFTLGAAHRNRLNGLFMATFFLGGAAGSALGGWAFERGHWALASSLGIFLPLLALTGFLLTAWRNHQVSRSMLKPIGD